MYTKSKIALWICAIAWMYVIYMFSSFDGGESANMSEGITKTIVGIIYDDFDSYDEEKQSEIIHQVHFYVRKTAHFLEYGLLAVIYNTLMLVYDKPRKKQMLWAVLCAGLYACTDEFHQGFVAGRGPSWVDVCIDTSGALFGTICLSILIFIVKCGKNVRGRRISR